MTITRIWQSGAESGSLDEFSGAVGHSIQTNSPKTGNYYFRLENYVTRYYDVSLPSTYQARMGSFFCMVSDNQSPQIFVIGSSYIQWLSSNGTIRLVANGVDQGNTFQFVQGVGNWYHLGLDVKIDPTNGWAYFYVDGNLIVSFDGNTGSSPITSVRFGTNNGNYCGYPAYDDMYVDDTTGESVPAALPLPRFYWLTPNGLGNYSQWTKSSGSDGYDLVDEAPPSDSDYIQADSVDELESYGVSSYTLTGSESCESIIPIVRASKAGTNEKIKVGTRLSGTDLLGNEQNLGTDPVYVWEHQPTKPGGGAWNQSDIDAFEILLQSSGSF